MSWSEATRTRVPSPMEMSPRRLFGNLEGIRVSLVSRSDLKKPELVVEEMTPLQARLFTKLDLSRYIKLNNF